MQTLQLITQYDKCSQIIKTIKENHQIILKQFKYLNELYNLKDITWCIIDNYNSLLNFSIMIQLN